MLGRKQDDGETVGTTKSGTHLTGIGGMFPDGEPIRPGFIAAQTEIESDVLVKEMLPSVYIGGELARGYIGPSDSGGNGGVTNRNVMKMVEQSILYR